MPFEALAAGFSSTNRRLCAVPLTSFELADSNVHQDGSQSSHLQYGLDHGDGNRISGNTGDKEELGKGGIATLSINGKPVAKGRIEKTQPLMFSADETADVGLDNQTPVVDGIGIGPVETRFTGKINEVTISVK